jgi:hypothetical protein
MMKPGRYTYVERNTVKGRTYLRFRRNGIRGPHLPGPEGSPEFLAAYADALAGKIEATPKRGVHAESGTIGALVISYQQSEDFLDLRDSSKSDYQNWLRKLVAEHGHRSLAGMTPEAVKAKILAPYADRPGSRHAIRRILKVITRHGIEAKLLHHDPMLGIKKVKLGEHRSWTEAEIAQFEDRWPIGTRERLALALALYTGQRSSDIRQMTWGTIIRCRNPCNATEDRHTALDPLSPES